MISVLMVTKGEHFAGIYIEYAMKLADVLGGELVLGLDRCDVGSEFKKPFVRTVYLESEGYLESVLDEAVAACSGDYILRLDDDEAASPKLAEWLIDGKFDSDVYSFPRLNMWTLDDAIITPPLYPDLQTRFTTRAKAGGRNQIHAGSPYGSGKIIDAPIIHHKFVLRDYMERLEIADTYEKTRQGAGFGSTFQPFNLPECSFRSIEVRKWFDGWKGEPRRIYFGGAE